LVSAVVPTRDRADLLGACLEGLFGCTEGVAIEVVVVDHGSREEATAALLRAARDRWAGRLRVVRDDDSFNFSRLCNRGAAVARGESILLLNNDVAPLRADWLAHMRPWLDHPGVGAVGARLLYPDGTIQHAGMHVGRGWTAHVHRGASGDAPGYRGRIARTATWSAATGACLLLRRADWERLGGLDEGLPVTWGDVDLCLRLRQEMGLVTVVAQAARLTHCESATRRHDPVEFAASAARVIARLPAHWTDPFAHPRYAPAAEDLDRSILPDTPADAPPWR
jgi:GT2 family glycosyltransferase